MEVCAEVGVAAVGAELELMENGDDVSVTEKPQVAPMDSMPHLLYLAEDSSDDEWDVPHRSLKSSKNDDVEATCHICQVTFSRAMSLSTHLQNAHQQSRLYCQTCKLSFINLWQLNKHIGKLWTTESCNTTPAGILSNSVNGSKGRQTILVEPGIRNKGPLNKLGIDVLNDHTYNNSFRIEKRNDHTYSMVNPGSHKIDPDPITLGGGIKQEKEEWVEPWDGGAPLPDWPALTQDTGSGDDIKTESSDETRSHLEERPGETEGDESASAPLKILDEEEEEEEEEESNTDSSLGGDSDFKPGDTSETESAESSGSGHPSSSKPSRNTRSRVKSNRCARCGGGPFLNMDWHAKRCVSGSSFTSKPSQIRPSGLRSNQCTRCLGGPFMNMDWHMKRCTGVKELYIQCSICTSCFLTEKALVEHKALVHNLSPPCPVKNVQNDPPAVSTLPAPVLVPVPAPAKSVSTGASHSQKCVHCGSGPFFSMDHHVQNCVRRTLLRCPLCSGLFPSDAAIMDHFVKIHKATAVRPVGELPGVLLPASSNSPGSSKPGPVSKTASVVFFNPMGVQGGQGLPTTQATAPIQSQTTTLPFHRMGTFLQSVSQMPSFVQSNIQAPVIAPTPAKPQAPTLVPVSVPAGSGSTLRKVTLQYTRPVHSPVSAPTTTPTQTHVLAAPAPAQLPPPSPAPLRIVKIFKNESRELALQRRLKMSWRSKSVYRCRQCGATSRQPSLAIRHRYLHRGPRAHRCHCGRTFRRLLYLLRHCMQHAEATRYICVTCGETFTGAGLLARHTAGTLKRPRLVGDHRYLRPLKKCQSEPFSCHCGKIFRRPSSYLWHQLQNRPIARLA